MAEKKADKGQGFFFGDLLTKLTFDKDVSRGDEPEGHLGKYLQAEAIESAKTLGL